MEEYSELKQILRSYGDKIVSAIEFYNFGEIPEKKLNNAIKTYANSVEQTKVYGLIDTTLLGSGKEGMLFTNAGIYIKEAFEKVKYIQYSEIEDVIVTSLEKEKDSDRVIEIICSNDLKIKIKSPFYQKTSMEKMLKEIIELKNDGRVGKSDKYVALEYMNDEVKENYIKVIIAFMNSDSEINEKEISELYSLMTQIKLTRSSRKRIQKYLENPSEDVRKMLIRMEMNIPEASEVVLHFSLVKDIIRIGKATHAKLDESQMAFISMVASDYNINAYQVDFLDEAIELDKKIFSGEFTEVEVISKFRELASKGAAVGVPVVAVYLSGSVLGLSVAGVTSGLAALGLGGILGLSSIVTGIGVAVLLGVGTYKGLKWITGGQDKISKREILIQGSIKNNKETIEYLIEDINALVGNIVTMLNSEDLDKKRIEILSGEIDLLNRVLKLLNSKNNELESLI
ncbi:hypothetical protein SAMN02745163_01588 [Clostridium cavendishii DSM 21758]|uniref:Uncharacterized protein n=1 Tax=Clostridium cavendishii DSM 21758 TaxID=1121302 RepID=A0A1M6HUR5_9CLOT|nr:hypothetical protein [Clostridium cavendishii]SHJ25935.1 hypothetical protein SAMN02745163_01588 [Clostridium cavendishii DSM 21758]